jgi:hypothetical protein
MSEAVKAFEAWSDGYDHDSHKWLDMGFDEAFIAGYRIALERAAQECERTYAKDAFHFELGTACAKYIRALLGATNADQAGK